MAVTPELLRDAAERVAVTAALAGISQIVVQTQGWDEWWVVPLAGILNIVKVLIAKNYGDPNTGGFTDITTPDDVDPAFLDDEPLDDTGNGIEPGVIQDVDQDPALDYGE